MSRKVIVTCDGCGRALKNDRFVSVKISGFEPYDHRPYRPSVSAFEGLGGEYQFCALVCINGKNWDPLQPKAERHDDHT